MSYSIWYSVVSYLCIGKGELMYLLLITSYYVVSVGRGFLFLLVLGA